MIVAVSGGPDSMALLRALQFLSKANLVLVAAHLNHALRGEESDADQAFVKDYCRANGIECRTLRVDVRGETSGENLESTARRIRYDWLIQIAKENNAAWIATGHTADDQAETVLHHIIRGTGLRGLRGIAPRRRLTVKVEVIRPLLEMGRVEVLAFLKAEQISTRQDSSNADLAYTRNRIRHELLPLLRSQFNPEMVRVLCRLANQASETHAEVERAAQMLLFQAEKPRAGTIVILDIRALAREERRVIREVFHLIWERENWPLGEMDHNHWNRLVDLVSGAGSHDLPDGVHARRKANVIQLQRTTND